MERVQDPGHRNNLIFGAGLVILGIIMSGLVAVSGWYALIKSWVGAYYRGRDRSIEEAILKGARKQPKAACETCGSTTKAASR